MYVVKNTPIDIQYRDLIVEDLVTKKFMNRPTMTWRKKQTNILKIGRAHV